ncbi:hypothetical protein M0804_003895 [Polistes exclamans]|nr:hypothetical protein M0804_003895 [Polistes exclamans]
MCRLYRSSNLILALTLTRFLRSPKSTRCISVDDELQFHRGDEMSEETLRLLKAIETVLHFVIVYYPCQGTTLMLRWGRYIPGSNVALPMTRPILPN